MEKLIKTLHNVEAHGYKIEELPGVPPFSEEQKKNFLIKQVLMRIATSIGEIATLSEPEHPHTTEKENLLKDSIAKLFINVLRLAKIQQLDEELLCNDIQRMLFKA